MVHQNGGSTGRQRGEPALGAGQPGIAPSLSALVRVSVQHGFVVADDPGRVGTLESLGLRGGAIGQEAVVVQQEQRRDHQRPAGVLPDRIRILRRVHTEALAHGDQVLVPLDAAQPERLPAVRPQFVVAGNPDHLGEPLPERAERPLDVGRELPDVAGDDEPVGW